LLYSSPPSVYYNVRERPIPQTVRGIHPSLFKESAMARPVPVLRIFVPNFGSFDVKRQSFVTVIDVLEQLHHYVYTTVDVKRLSVSEQQTASLHFHRRRSSDPHPDFRKVDVLGERVIFSGLSVGDGFLVAHIM
jgi:hypothetical protein